jgi:two-component system alkaline phosphatase synthesis response regulator PhoP
MSGLDLRHGTPVGEAPPPGGTAARHQPTILMVDDDRVICRYLDLTLGRSGGYTVEIANDVGSALDILNTTLVDLIVSDVAMPDQDGFQFFRRMRRDHRFRSIPFIVLSSDNRIATKVGGLAMGIDDYLTKPVDMGELKARIDSVLRRAEAGRAASRTRRYSLAGDFSGMPFCDLVTLLDQGRRTGRLAVVTARACAEVRFDRGQAVAASYGNLSGEEAVYRLMREPDGQFEFAPDAQAGEAARTIMVSTTALLMEGARRLDDAFAEDDGVRVLDPVDPDRATTARTSAAGQTGQPSSPVAAEEIAAAIADPFALGELQLLGSEALRAWTTARHHRDRVQALLVAEPGLGIPALMALAAPLSEHEVQTALRQAPLAVALAFHLRHERLVDVVLVDQDRIGALLPLLRSRPAAVIVAPSGGDLLGLAVRSKVELDALVKRLAPPAVIGCGNHALADEFAQRRGFLRGVPHVRHLPGMLGDPGCDLRSVLQAAIALWNAPPGDAAGEVGHGD